MTAKSNKINNNSGQFFLNENQVIKAEDGSYYLTVKISKETFYSLLAGDNNGKNFNINMLTEREIEVLRLVAKSKTNAQIGKILSISPHTVKAHIANILEKLSAEDRTQAVITGILAKLIDI